jgi:hypothetical protein
MQLIDIIRNVNKKYEANPQKYFKSQYKNFRNIEKIPEHDRPDFSYFLEDFKIFITNAYNYALETRTIPIKFNYLYLLVTINTDKELAKMLFFLFGSLYISLGDALNNDERNWNFERKKKTVEETKQFLKDIFSSIENLYSWFELFIPNLFSEKEIFKNNIQNFVILKEYIDPEIYQTFLIKIIRRYPDAFDDSSIVKDLKRNEDCSNIFYETPGMNEVFKIYDKEKNITYCLDEEEKEEYLRTNHNPYAPVRDDRGTRGTKNIFLDPRNVSDVKLDRDLYHWTDQIYTNNQIFKYFDAEQIDRLRTTIPETNITLYRGMKYECNADKLIKNNSGDNDMCEITFNTFSSWSKSQPVARRFAGYSGVLLKYTFTPDQLVADLTKIKNRTSEHEKELEVIALPGIYKCEIIKDEFDLKANFINECEISRLDYNIKKIKEMVRTKPFLEWVKKNNKEIKYKEFFETLELFRKGDETIVNKINGKLLNNSELYKMDGHTHNELVACKIIQYLTKLIETKSFSVLAIFINFINH